MSCQKVVAREKDLAKSLVLGPQADYSRQAHAFSHIFGGGYAAGYYSYLWSEVVCEDMFQNIIGSENPQLESKRWHRKFLAKGSSQPMEKLVQNYLNRDFSSTALLEYYGIDAK